ncbi:hypothetical protein pYptb0024 (plasmid) [Yersinia pseudotuberculosis IP 32953]|uniref:Uncharacterized protein n=1 Tax=Yersinia pseudotuberculosis serotype I (strain IP32953) TaxID=273123 RepID=Q663D0_YERPS|nr:hypothetical protein pYptb0024 [Yersinia pseudotuberculosis IP 32953]
MPPQRAKSPPQWAVNLGGYIPGQFVQQREYFLRNEEKTNGA